MIRKTFIDILFSVYPKKFLSFIAIDIKTGVMTVAQSITRKDAADGLTVLVSAAEVLPTPIGRKKRQTTPAYKTTLATVIVKIQPSNLNTPVVTANFNNGYIEENKRPDSMVWTATDFKIIMQLKITDADLVSFVYLCATSWNAIHLQHVQLVGHLTLLLHDSSFSFPFVILPFMI
jgi:hypothetical protein